MADLMAAGDQSRCVALRSATTPEMAGAAIDVPDSIMNPRSLKVVLVFVAASMLTPGAAISGCIATHASYVIKSILRQTSYVHGL